jgi:hypothetical protein
MTYLTVSVTTGHIGSLNALDTKCMGLNQHIIFNVYKSFLFRAEYIWLPGKGVDKINIFETPLSYLVVSNFLHLFL